MTSQQDNNMMRAFRQLKMSQSLQLFANATCVHGLRNTIQCYTI